MFSVLGVIPIYADSLLLTVDITSDGKFWGLSTKWSSQRPIVKDKGIVTLVKQNH